MARSGTGLKMAKLIFHHLKTLRNTPIESPILVSPSSSVGSSSPVRSTTPPPDYPFDESIFAELDNSLSIIPRPLGSEPMPPKRTSTSETPTMTQAAIRQLIADGIAAALEAQAATMENTNRNVIKLILPRDELVLLNQQLVLLEENSSYCSRLQLPVLNQSVNTARITVVGEKVNAAESLLVISTEVNDD
ncbi:hypothetical protein Tco_0319781 [Tanacetum coccineum]